MSRGCKELLDRRAPQGRRARRDQLDRKVKTARRGLREHRGQPDHKAGRAKKAMQGRRDRRVRRFPPVPQVLRASQGGAEHSSVTSKISRNIGASRHRSSWMRGWMRYQGRLWG